MAINTGNIGKTLFLLAPPQRGLLEGFASGLISLANFVEIHEPGTDIRLLDLSQADPLDIDGVLRTAFTSAGEALVGITATTASYYNAILAARACKRLRPDIPVVLGGHHATSQDDVILRRHPEVDIVVCGEGERAILSLLRSFPELSGVPGISYRSPFGVQRNPPAPLLETAALDEISPVFRQERLHAPPGKFDHATYVSARGCPLRCAFCCVGNSRIRAKSVAAIVSDLRYLIAAQGHQRLAIEDNFFAHSPSRTIELCAALEKLQLEHRFSWDCQTRVESLRDRAVIAAMEQAGCEAVYIGVEALTPRGLAYLGKTAQPAKYLDMLLGDVLPRMMCSRIGTYINLQFGLPGGAEDAESQRVLANIAGIATAAGRTVTVFPQLHVVYPGTSHFRMCLEQGLFGSDGNAVFETFTAWEAAQEPILNWLGEHFAHGVGGIPIGILSEAALRAGRFEIDPESVARIDRCLRTIGTLPRISVFRYAPYLVKAEIPVGEEA